ncbi:hypothetical protein COU17_00745 [Candidatus Kaiserbacteria bacterium CG10_big_fil_rev_8_21_14_0_10_49_17]|uniref:Methyltransferase domain-containing protein n=1 Tax=Candidatus Kaiserbacteria bacterium CG10_big_fil_rev_8_21_14_0_10_49_17 TaxID=1974609 RepID=A0A2M6WEV7_9BACT|nr:MAG: hypothetical protein COU17_00745 [Candidatus Kaiserbacteria bacterium CG10_big_fil_rev_8_21_14_0_10_49_17]
MKYSILRYWIRRIPGLLDDAGLYELDTAVHSALMKRNGRDMRGTAHLAYWERMARLWGRYPPPIRPSVTELRIYRDMLAACSAQRILILGSTPELRDCAARTGADVFVADFAPSMPAAMLRFTELVDPEKERWIKDDWTRLPFPDHFFDVILGDVALHQVSPAREEALLQRMQSLLAPDGRLITRLFFIDDYFQEQNFRDMTISILSSPVTEVEKSALLRLQSVWYFADTTKRHYDRPQSLAAFDAFIRDENLRDPILEDVRASLAADAHSYRNWSPSDEETLTALIGKYFHISDKQTADDYPHARLFPIVSLSLE